MMSETTEEQRTRILAHWFPNNEIVSDADKGRQYDLAVALGYEPESWDGMWKLTTDPFTFRRGKVIAREVVQDENHHAVMDGDTYKTRLVAHKLPEGWTVIDDRRLTDIHPHYTFVSPRDRVNA